jgi:SM-20-related protein
MDEIAEKDFVIIDQFLPDPLYSSVRSAFLSKLPEFSLAGIGAQDMHTVQKEIRNDQTYWLDSNRDLALKPFFDLLQETMHMFNRYCFLSLSGYEFHFAHYPPGGHYAKHVDQFQNRNNRMISVVIYLNEAWQNGDGGELEIHLSGGGTKLVEPRANTCVMFRSDSVPHAVLESYKSRYSLTGWLLYVPPALAPLFG